MVRNTHYSSDDKDFAGRLYADLRAANIRCWYNDHEMRGGRKLQAQINEAIRVHDKLLVILSDSSMKSQWVKDEIAEALQKEKESGEQVLFPIRITKMENLWDLLGDWRKYHGPKAVESAAEIPQYYIPNFSSWKEDHDGYRGEFDKLLRDLRPGD